MPLSQITGRVYGETWYNRDVLHEGDNLVNDVPVAVERKAVRRINVRVRPDGRVYVSLPNRRLSLRDAEAFLLAHWDWVLKARAELLSRPQPAVRPVTPEELAQLGVLLDALTTAWCTRLGEPGVTWKTRTMKSLWGSCHIRKRVITYNTKLAHAAPELVEYVVVHELTHLKVPNHGPRFRALMDVRLPDWPVRRRRLRTV